jgi:hypothetical protein
MPGTLATFSCDSSGADMRPRNPKRRPLVIRKEEFSRLQVTQRKQREFPDNPEFDLGYLGSAALSLVFAMPNADELILRQARLEYLEEVRSETP